MISCLYFVAISATTSTPLAVPPISVPFATLFLVMLSCINSWVLSCTNLRMFLSTKFLLLKSSIGSFSLKILFCRYCSFPSKFTPESSYSFWPGGPLFEGGRMSQIYTELPHLFHLIISLITALSWIPFCSFSLSRDTTLWMEFNLRNTCSPLKVHLINFTPNFSFGKPLTANLEYFWLHLSIPDKMRNSNYSLLDLDDNEFSYSLLSIVHIQQGGSFWIQN